MGATTPQTDAWSEPTELKNVLTGKITRFKSICTRIDQVIGAADALEHLGTSTQLSELRVERLLNRLQRQLHASAVPIIDTEANSDEILRAKACVTLAYLADGPDADMHERSTRALAIAALRYLDSSENRTVHLINTDL